MRDNEVGKLKSYCMIRIEIYNIYFIKKAPAIAEAP